MEPLPEKVTAGHHFQSLPKCIKRQLCTTEILTADFGKKQAVLILHKAILKLHKGTV